MKPPLAGRRIVVTRPAAQAGKLIEGIGAQGGEALSLPLLEIGPCADPAALERSLAQLEDHACAIFISPNAVAYALPLVRARGAWPAGVRAAAIGASTAAALIEAGVGLVPGSVLVPAGRSDSEALLDLPEFAAARVAGRRFLIVRGNGGREVLAETLRERGALVAAVAAYERRPAPAAGKLVSLLRNKDIDALTISSSESLRILFAMLDTEACESLRTMPTFVPHPRIAAVAAALGLREVVLTAPADAGLIAGLCKYNWSAHE